MNRLLSIFLVITLMTITPVFAAHRNVECGTGSTSCEIIPAGDEIEPRYILVSYAAAGNVKILCGAGGNPDDEIGTLYFNAAGTGEIKLKQGFKKEFYCPAGEALNATKDTAGTDASFYVEY